MGVFILFFFCKLTADFGKEEKRELNDDHFKCFWVHKQCLTVASATAYDGVQRSIPFYGGVQRTKHKFGF